MKEAKKTLTKLIYGKPIEPEELEHAIQKGLLFSHVDRRGHDECMRRISEVLETITPEDVANAFLYSLSTRQLEYRSALGSYWYAKAIVPHEHNEAKMISDKISFVLQCDICRWWPDFKSDTDNIKRNNRRNAERYVFGGLHHTHADYALFDLEEFLKLPKVEHTKEDEDIFRRILSAVDKLEPQNKARSLQKAITAGKFIKSNKQEVDTIIEILGICGILENKEHHCYDEGFMDCLNRNPPELTNDYSYPVNWWRAKDGVNKDRLKLVFGISF